MEKEISRRDRKKRQVLTTLVDVTMKLFIEKGFAETTIAEIASAADIGTGTFYNYFHSNILSNYQLPKFYHKAKLFESFL